MMQILIFFEKKTKSLAVSNNSFYICTRIQISAQEIMQNSAQETAISAQEIQEWSSNFSIM